MSMSKKDFIALADFIKEHNTLHSQMPFTDDHLETLAQFCREANSNFKHDRWIGYIKGENGKNGGLIK